jgi:tetratricopeptide (TPR) repeat protein
MKRISLLLIAMFLFAGANLKSQTTAGSTSVLDYEGLQSKMSKSDDDTLNPKKNIKVKTWTSRAQLFIDVFNVHNTILHKGMDPLQLKLFMKEPKEIQTSQEGANKIEIFVYERVNVKFINGIVDSWTETQKIYPDPLPEAKKALDKAIKLNTDGKADEDIVAVIENLKLAYQTEGVDSYERRDYKSAHQSFVNVLGLNKIPQMKNRVDTILIYYAGKAAMENKDNTEANRLFEEAAATGFDDPSLYVDRKNSYMQSGDTAKGLAVITEGFKKYPNNLLIMNELINYYLATNQGEEALRLINVAKSIDPKNAAYAFVEGVLFDKLGRYEEAEAAYKTCIEMNPEYYDAIYNLGVIYFNKAVKIYEKASKTADNAEYEKLQLTGDEMLKQAIPYLEKCGQNDASTEDLRTIRQSSLETLKTIYYRLKMEDKRQEVINKLNAQ